MPDTLKQHNVGRPRRRRWLVASMSLALVALIAARGSAQSVDHAATIAQFVADDTFFVSYVDVASLPAAEAPNELFQLGIQLPPEVQARLIGPMILSSLTKRLQDAGGQGIYTVMGLADVNSVGGPVLVATVQSGKSPDAIVQLARTTIQTTADDPSQISLIPVARSLVVRRVDDVVLIGTESVVERYASRKPSPRTDLTKPLAEMAADDTTIAAVFAPGVDFRRVVRELWPQLPSPLEKLRGDLADRWLRLEFAAKAQMPPTLSLTLVASDATAANDFAEIVATLPAASVHFEEAGGQRLALRRTLQTILDTLPIRVEGSRAVMSLPGDAAQLAKLNALIGGASEAALESSWQHQRVQKFKEMALGALNYESAKRQLPPPAIRDKDGRPLLSWRVAILPYMDEGALYKRFHLDEPWDSPHNLTLAKQMPKIYADPAHPELASEGKTNYLAPIAPGTIFDNPEGLLFKDVSDGTSKTILLVEAPADRAVVWTKPDDLQIDLQNPQKSLQRADSSIFVAAYSDGHVRTIPLDADPVKLRAAFTRNGGETVDYP